MLNGEVMRTQEDEYRASNRQIRNLIDPFVARSLEAKSERRQNPALSS